jgi:hypothetical protein
VAILRTQIDALTMSSKDSATVGAGYAALNAGGLAQSCSILRIVNDSNQAITVSYDGVTDQDYVAANTSLQLYFQTNAQPDTGRALLARGTVVSVKGTAGVGTIKLIGYFQKLH